MATAKDKVRATYPKAHATKHTRHGLKGDYWLVWDQRLNSKRLGTGTTQAAAWKDALETSVTRPNESGSPT